VSPEVDEMFGAGHGAGRSKKRQRRHRMTILEP
jgi:hypothetical protein